MAVLGSQRLLSREATRAVFAAKTKTDRDEILHSPLMPTALLRDVDSFLCTSGICEMQAHRLVGKLQKAWMPKSAEEKLDAAGMH